jgi:hypothetical protein
MQPSLPEDFLTNGTAAERMEDALKSLCGYCYTPELWENVIFPNRVENYKPELLDKLLAEGGFSWRMEGDGALAFMPMRTLTGMGSP